MQFCGPHCRYRSRILTEAFFTIVARVTKLSMHDKLVAKAAWVVLLGHRLLHVHIHDCSILSIASLRSCLRVCRTVKACS